MRGGLVLISVLSLILSSVPALAWWDGGHMQIAAVAYSKLTPQAKAKADALIKLNPDYQIWIAGVPDDKKAQYAFVHAAVWADDTPRTMTRRRGRTSAMPTRICIAIGISKMSASRPMGRNSPTPIQSTQSRK
ncbi:S1/P1 nuclease [Mesorhizobium sp.]|uniref:S1/P1 nuclease n=1 Tax=Mesorhizobium sp. TaxID=1871066 RepID=UPI0025F97FAB|nr:S1/P1 nuclease [Mesorhizobium sp.]